MFGGLSRAGKGVPIVLALAAIVLMFYFAWPELNADLDEDGFEFLLLFDRRLWMLLGAGLAGYVVAVVTDKGPVGPLE